jgi:glycerol uptake facilitator-like aquaporin
MSLKKKALAEFMDTCWLVFGATGAPYWQPVLQI